jgi:pimeloyl-ACP methyl ester carboxylesterase
VARSEFDNIRFTTRDGLRLGARIYDGDPLRRRRTVLCLAGLTRNGRDFHRLALALSRDADHPRTVFTLDSRGRGASDRDREWKNYTVVTEMHDVLDFATLAGVHDTAVIGTSRGGLIAMVVAAVRPTLLGALVLNDIGPVIEREGLVRIAGYVGRTPLPASWAEAARLVRDMNQRQFPAVAESEWEELARQFFDEKDGRPAPSYDPNLARTFSVLDAPVPALWPQFEALKRVPVLVLRGEHSDILSPGTVEEMRRRHPDVESHVVPGQGHAPLLRDAATVAAIRRFLNRREARSAAEQAPAVLAPA